MNKTSAFASFAMKLLVIAILGLISTKAAVIPENLGGQALVDHINENADTWTAKLSELTHEELRSRTMDSKYGEISADAKVAPEITIDDDIPDSFDGRVQWPNCLSLMSVTDQSHCGSCWAVSTAAAITDRICVANGGARNDPISAADIMSCCGGFCGNGNGCNGGYSYEAFEFYRMNGLVTGSSYMDNSGCMPYSIPPCGKRNGTNYSGCPKTFPSPQCEKKCTSCYSESYANDKNYGRSSYRLAGTVAAIQKEIMTHGPAVGSMAIYSDLYYYDGGIYKQTSGTYEGWHAFKILGWGTENGTDFWLMANSWGVGWGEGGFIRMVRGTALEGKVVAGLPRI